MPELEGMTSRKTGKYSRKTGKYSRKTGKYSRKTGKYSRITTGHQLGKAANAEKFKEFLIMDRPEHHRFDRGKRSGERKWLIFHF